MLIAECFFSEVLMKGDAKVIAVLNEVLKAELTAINQYFLHAEMCENWGYEKLAAHTRKESIEEMTHAEKLMERILYLDGTPNMSDYFKINIGPDVKAQLQNDLNVEYDAVKRLNRGVALCVQLGDNGSRELLESILTDEEEHIDWLEAQLHAISEMGIENYLAQHLHEEKED
jgi:bacterioferritin